MTLGVRTQFKHSSILATGNARRAVITTAAADRSGMENGQVNVEGTNPTNILLQNFTR